MRIDWIVSVVIFLMLTTWGIAHYSLIGSSQTVSKAGAALQSAERIVDYMSADLLSIPANITAPANANDATVWAYMNWTGDGANSARVVLSRLSATSLPCNISGDTLYWKANLTTGSNYFFIENMDWDTAPNCVQPITPTSENQSMLWAAESAGIFSADKNGQVCAQINQSYQGQKSNIGVTFEFNVLIEDGSTSECGIPVPASGRDVFVFPFSGRLWEGGNVNISVRLW